MLKICRQGLRVGVASALLIGASIGDSLQAQSAPGPSSGGAIAGVLQPVLDWFERAHREYQGVVVKDLSIPTGKPEVVAQQTTVGPAHEHRPDDVTAAGPPGLARVEQPAPVDKSVVDAQVRKQVQARIEEKERAGERQRLAEAVRSAQAALDVAAKQRQADEVATRMAEAERAKRQAAVDQTRVATATVQTGPGRDVTAAATDKPHDNATVATGAAAAAGGPDTPGHKGEPATTSSLAQAAPPPSGYGVVSRQPPPSSHSQSARPTSPPAAMSKAAEVRWNRLPRPIPVGSVEKAGATTSEAAKLAAAASRAADRMLEGGGRNERKISVAKGYGEHDRAARSCRRAGKTIDPPGTYTVRRGDSLWTIARRHYDRGRSYTRIVKANDGTIADPDLIRPCQKVFLPGRHVWVWEETGESPT